MAKKGAHKRKKNKGNRAGRKTPSSRKETYNRVFWNEITKGGGKEKLDTFAQRSFMSAVLIAIMLIVLVIADLFVGVVVTNMLSVNQMIVIFTIDLVALVLSFTMLVMAANSDKNNEGDKKVIKLRYASLFLSLSSLVISLIYPTLFIGGVLFGGVLYG